MEEPPAHVIFILATTEKHKILPTILSRCQIYDFERMTVQNTIDHLKHVAEKEGIQYEDAALAVIAEKADGGMRDALSIFDQAASFCQGNITYQKVIEDLNVLDSDNYFRMVDLAIQNKVSDIMVLLNSIISNGFDGGLLIQGLAKHVRNVLMAKDPQTLPLLEVSDQAKKRYTEQAQHADTRFLYGALKLMNQCDINYRQSGNKRLLVELTLIEIAQLTQPEEGPANGRQPRRLKSLFKQLIQQAQPKPKAAPQVAVAAPQSQSKVVEPVQTGSVSNTPQTPPPSAPSTPRPTLKTGSIGITWNNLRGSGRKLKIQLPSDVAASNGQSTEQANFSLDELQLQWVAMCNRMPERLSGIAARMKNMNPVIRRMPEVEVVVPNEIIKDEMEQIRGSIVNTLKIYQQFDLMTSKNPAIERLRKEFGLELV